MYPQENELVTVLYRINEDWLYGEVGALALSNGSQGYMEEEIVPYAIALYDFDGVEEGDLSFRVCFFLKSRYAKIGIIMLIFVGERENLSVGPSHAGVDARTHAFRM